MYNLKLQTKENLKPLYLKSVVVSFLLIATFAFILLINVFFSVLVKQNGIALLSESFINLILYVCLLNPLLYGVLYWFYYSLSGNNIKLFECFYFFGNSKNYKRAVSLSIKATLRTSFIYFVFSIPTFLNSYFKYGEIFNDIFGLFSTIGLFLCIYQQLKYFVAPILLINDSSLSASGALYLSAEISFNNKLNILGFILSFFGYFLLCFFVFPTIFILPYYLACYCNKCKELINKYNYSVKTINRKFYKNYFNFLKR